MAFFSGSVIHTVDSKGRINIPARYRNQLGRDAADNGDGLVFYVTTGGPADCLNVIPLEDFEIMASKMEDECGPFLNPNESIRDFTEMMASAEACRCDQNGRLIVPKKHMEKAGIQDEVKIVGLGKRIQLWNPDRFETYILKQNLSK